MAVRATVTITFALAIALAAIYGQESVEPAPAVVEFSCPMDPDVRSKGPGKCSKCGMKLEPAIRDIVEYPLAVRVLPSGEIDFRVTHPKTGEPVTRFEIVHEKLFHVFLVSGDLSYFAHVHPEPRADGSFRLKAALEKPGAYRILSDYYPAGGSPQLTPRTYVTPGYKGPLMPASLAPDLSPKKAENLEVELSTEPPQPIAGKKTLLFFKVKPGEGLEPYLGAWGHLLAASNDLIDMIHGHPSIADGGPQVQFDVFFPREATYRIWVQFQRLGRVNTASFTVPVSRLK